MPEIPSLLHIFPDQENVVLLFTYLLNFKCGFPLPECQQYDNILPERLSCSTLYNFLTVEAFLKSIWRI